jgi:hypothetical protein
MGNDSPAHSDLRSRAAEELKRYALVSAYLFVCFAVVMFYDASQATATQGSWVGLSMALVKALVVGKFILIGEALKPGTRLEARTLIERVAWRTLGLLFVLIVLKIIEELIIGLVHGKTVSGVLGEFAARSWMSLSGPVVLMLLILIPLVAATEIDRALGNGGLKRLLLTRED